MALMTRTRKLLAVQEVSDTGVYYTDPDAEHDELAAEVFITRQDYDDMGAPEQITMSIEPGDHLN